MMDLCGWTANGVFVAFLQQTIFLLLIMTFLHVLLSMQPYWYGWLTDGVLVGIVCIFTPIAPLRHILAGFFKVIMFNSNALFHIGVCLLLSAVLAFVGLSVLKKKTTLIFWRKSFYAKNYCTTNVSFYTITKVGLYMWERTWAAYVRVLWLLPLLLLRKLPES